MLGHWYNKINGFLGPVPTPEKWVFIVGCYNSGTTLLHELLASLPMVGSMPDEGQFFTDQFPIPKVLNLPRIWALQPELFYLDENSPEPPDPRVVKRQWGARYNYPDRPILLEKSPPNVARMRWLQKHFRDAHFIGIIRNGYAVAEGIRRKAGHSIEIAATQWLVSNRVMLDEFEKLDRKILVKYEDLTAAPIQVLKVVSEFLAIDFAEYDLAEKNWQIHERFAPIQDMNHTSILSLTEEDQIRIKGIAGELLDEFDYQPKSRNAASVT